MQYVGMITIRPTAHFQTLPRYPQFVALQEATYVNHVEAAPLFIEELLGHSSTCIMTASAVDRKPDRVGRISHTVGTSRFCRHCARRDRWRLRQVDTLVTTALETSV